jgi:hypothetical protein
MRLFKGDGAMRGAIIVACVLAAVGCRKPGGRAAPPPETERPAVEPEPDPRQEALEAEWALYDDVVISHDAGSLGEGERRMLGHLIEAARLVEELHMLQVNPKNLEWKERIAKEGTEVEMKVFTRYQRPWCAEGDCCALADCPEKKVGWVHWPDDLTDGEYAALGGEPNARELMSPFTVVVRAGEGYAAVPYASTGVLGPRMKRVAKELRAAAASAPDESLGKFLESRAGALESYEPFPYDDSDYDWIALGGDWEVTVGPYETYGNPHQVKALFEMYVGRVDEELTADLARFKDNLQGMEDALGKLVGPSIYRSRKLDPRISIRAVDVWMASGDGRMDRGATVAFHLPNRGRSVDEGLYKKVMMINHSMAFEDVVRARADKVLDEDERQMLDVRADITNVTFHEFSHGFGAYHEMQVRTPSGGKVSVKEAMGENDALLEELKADTLGLWLVSFERSSGWLDEEAAKRRYVSALMHILGLLQYPLDGTYPRMVAIQLGWYLDEGGVTWDPSTGRFRVDFGKLPAAVESLAREVATIQLTGDGERGRALVSRYIEKTGEESYALKGTLERARQDMIARFKEAGIRSPSLRYEVTGL